MPGERKRQFTFWPEAYENLIGLHGLGGHAAAAVEEHGAIYRAIRDGEPEVAAEATSVHLDNTLEDYRREIQRRVFG